MRILMLTSEFAPFRGGIATYAAELALAACEQGHDVTVAAPDYYADQSAADAALPYRTIRFPGGPNRAQDIVAKLFWVRRLAARERFDLVHAIDWPFFLPLALSGFRGRERCLLTFHGTEINMMARASRRPLLGLARFWNGWAGYVANSRFTADHLSETFPQVARASVRAIPLGVRPPAHPVTQTRAAARQALGIDGEAVMLLSLGRVVRRKGCHVTAAALALLPEEMQRRLVWAVVGPLNDAGYADELRAAAAPLDVHTLFTDGVPDDRLATLFAAADMFVLPAVMGSDGAFEGFGLVYIEAGLRRIPAIGTRLGGIPDAVVDGTSGLLVPPDDPKALADAIRVMVDDPDLRARLAEGALAHALACNWDRVARETYAEVTKGL